MEIIQVLKANGKTEPYKPEKLKGSLLRSGASEEVALDVLEKIKPDLHDGISTGEIYKRAFEILRELEMPIARRYSLRRAIMDLGPTGFPFEEFVAEILKVQGYDALTGQEVLGGCVPHEVDVVAWKEGELIMAETKFHNSLGTKSDLKVALYVKARMDDLEENVYSYGGKERKITGCWLVTNTKFSSTAIHYAECKGLTLIGWNYPKHGNLQEMIEQAGLHPITCLESLSEEEKRLLVTGGVMLCSKISENPEVLQNILGKNFDSEPVIREVNLL